MPIVSFEHDRIESFWLRLKQRVAFGQQFPSSSDLDREVAAGEYFRSLVRRERAPVPSQIRAFGEVIFFQPSFCVSLHLVVAVEKPVVLPRFWQHHARLGRLSLNCGL